MANRGTLAREPSKSSSLTELLYSLCSLYANNKGQGILHYTLVRGWGTLYNAHQNFIIIILHTDGVSYLYRHSLSMLGWYVYISNGFVL